MNYTKLITKKKQYKYSVNICLDLRTEERLADFMVYAVGIKDIGVSVYVIE